MTTQSISIDGARLSRTLAELGRIGETPQGMMRLAYSPYDQEGRPVCHEPDAGRRAWRCGWTRRAT